MAAPKLRFKEVSEDWGSKKIIELADYVDYRGKTPKKVESGVLLVTAKNIKQGYLDYSASQEFIEESAFDDVMRRGKVELNDVLITTEAPLGNVASVDRTDIALAQRVIKYRGKIGLLDNLFLKQKFLSESFQEILKSKATGGTVQGIKGSVLHQIPLIVPSKEEQTKIASFLSAVDEKISQLTQKHQLLSQYKQGMMQKLFSQQLRFKADDGSEFGEWEEKKLGDVCSRNYQGINTVADKVEYQKVGYPILQAKHITSEKLDFYDARFLSELDFEKYKDKYIPNPNDILFSNIGTIGKVVLVDESKSFFIAWNIFLISVKMNLIVPLYLASYLRWLTSLNYFDNLQTGNATKFINKTDLLDTKVNLPCLEEQIKIANFLSSIDQKIEGGAQKIEQAKQWKKGLLQQMFV
ncbi:MAG: restriction endonuclease subunit S [Flavobacterium sp.]|nr:restriction endonuclease subunit S [Candidatus Neoflavobacterium equi]